MCGVKEFYMDIVRFPRMDNKLDPKFDYDVDFTIQEKFDGSHGCIFKYLGETYYASRNVVLEEKEKKNSMFNFKKLAVANTGIQKYINSYPDHVLYGEFMGNVNEPKFYVFDIGKVIVVNEETTRIEMMNFPDLEKTLAKFKILYISTEFHKSGLFETKEAVWRQCHPNIEGAVFKFYKNKKMLKVLKVLNNNYIKNVPAKVVCSSAEAVLWNNRQNSISSCLLNMPLKTGDKVYMKELIDNVVADLMDDVKDNSVTVERLRHFVAKKIIDTYKNIEMRKNVFGNFILYSKSGIVS